jgi:multimeric flavodoxin WrbA
MKIIGYMGSPRLNGLNAKLIDGALKGAQSKGAEIKCCDLINCNIQFCRGCFQCMFEHHELPIGRCILDDDMAAIWEEYRTADGYILASPVYDVGVTALMKRFLERKCMLHYRRKEDRGRFPDTREKAGFKKKVSLIVTGNAADEYREVMGPPCFDTMESHFFIEEIDTVDRLYVGGVESLSDERLSEKLQEAFMLGVNLVEGIEGARSAGLSCQR